MESLVDIKALDDLDKKHVVSKYHFYGDKTRWYSELAFFAGKLDIMIFERRLHCIKPVDELRILGDDQIILSATKRKAKDGKPGVNFVTPLVLKNKSAKLLHRMTSKYKK